MIVAKLSLDSESTKIDQIDVIRAEQFWSNDFLTSSEFKNNFQFTITFFNTLHLVVMGFGFLIGFLLSTVPNVNSKFMMNENWPIFIDILYKILTFTFTTIGYYIGNTYICYYGYNILHCHLQKEIIICYFWKEFGKYKKISLKNKMFSKTYQKKAADIFKKSIIQFQVLKRCF